MRFLILLINKQKPTPIAKALQDYHSIPKMIPLQDNSDPMNTTVPITISTPSSTVPPTMAPVSRQLA